MAADSWSVLSSTVNLPAVLNDPGKGKQRDFFTRSWGVDFAGQQSGLENNTVHYAVHVQTRLSCPPPPIFANFRQEPSIDISGR